MLLKWSFLFFILAAIAALFGFTHLEVAAMGVAKVLFFIFLALFLVSLIVAAITAGKIKK